MRGRMMRDLDLAALTSQNEPIVRWLNKIGCAQPASQQPGPAVHGCVAVHSVPATHTRFFSGKFPIWVILGGVIFHVGTRSPKYSDLVDSDISDAFIV